jgi:SAM-dependent methyltransferase
MVLAAEPTAERAGATRQRPDAWPREHLRVVSSGAVDLAVRPGTIDLAVVELLSQGRRPPPGWVWGGQTVPARPLLQSIHAALKPGGVLYVGLPRQAGRPAASGLFSLLSMGRVRRLLTQTGYGEIRVWCAYPDCADPRFLVACEQPVFEWFLRLAASRTTGPLRTVAQRLVNATHLLKYTAPGYSLRARRTGATPE